MMIATASVYISQGHSTTVVPCFFIPCVVVSIPLQEDCCRSRKLEELSGRLIQKISRVSNCPIWPRFRFRFCVRGIVGGAYPFQGLALT